MNVDNAKDSTMRGRPKKSWDEMVKEDLKRGLCINYAKELCINEVRDKWIRCYRRVEKTLPLRQNGEEKAYLCNLYATAEKKKIN